MQTPELDAARSNPHCLSANSLVPLISVLPLIFEVLSTATDPYLLLYYAATQLVRRSIISHSTNPVIPYRPIDSASSETEIQIRALFTYLHTVKSLDNARDTSLMPDNIH